MRSTCKIRKHAHSHESICLRCEQIKVTLEEVKDTIQQHIDETRNSNNIARIQKMEDRMIEFKDAYEKIYAWKRHIVRAYSSSKARQSALQKVSNSFAIIIIDFAQKYLRSKHHESQSDYFAKQGMSWSLAHIIVRKHGRIAQHTFVHILKNFDQVKIITKLQNFI